MTDFASLSADALAERRRRLRRQRRWRNVRSIWRVLAVSGIAVGTFWLISRPSWSLRSSQQVIVEGNQLLSDQAIRSRLSLTYPQSLLDIEPEALGQSLQAHAPIVHTTISRQLFPPRLKVYVQERWPVAMTLPPVPQTGQSKQPPDFLRQQGLIDSEGHWIPLATFTDIDPGFDLPELRLRGFSPQYQTQWPELYEAIQNSPVEVLEVDWRLPSNLILHTRAGVAHLGPYTPQLIHQQISTLAQLQTLSQAEHDLEIEYIDLSNPKAPAVKLDKPPTIP